MDKNNNTFDYIIIGAGSAGCVVANRLSENPDVTVCLIEAGKKDTNPLLTIPAGYSATVTQGLFSWPFNTVPQKGLNNRIGFQPRGKVLGGSSSVNGMVYLRGSQWDFDNWAALGNEGWSYKGVLPYFKKSENNENIHDEFHGKGGALNVMNLPSPSFLNEVFLKACESIGLKRNSDPNGAEQYGCFSMQVTQKNGARCSTSKAFIHPVMNRKNLTVMMDSHVELINFEKRDGKLFASSVSLFSDKNKSEKKVLVANREIILSAGAYGSPQILMLSGVGNKHQLEALGIECVNNLPGVGENLQDHLTVVPLYRTFSHRGTFGFSFLGALSVIFGLLDWLLRRKGKLTTNFAESGAFFKSDDSKPASDIEVEFVIAAVDDHGRKPHKGHGYCTHTTLVRPKSKGSVKLKDKHPLSVPLIDPAFLMEEEDMTALVKGLQKTLEIMETDFFKPYNKGMIYPVDRNNVEQLQEYIRQHSDTEYHPVGTCKMGVDETAVVNPKLKVKGIENLRVIDASIMPEIVGANTNAATIMIAEKGADLIKKSF